MKPFPKVCREPTGCFMLPRTRPAHDRKEVAVGFRLGPMTVQPSGFGWKWKVMVMAVEWLLWLCMALFNVYIQYFTIRSYIYIYIYMFIYEEGGTANYSSFIYVHVNTYISLYLYIYIYI